MSDGQTDDLPPSLWTSLGPVEQAREWEDFRPGTFDIIFNYAKQQAEDMRSDSRLRAQHEMRMDYMAVILQSVALIFGITAVVIMAFTAKYYLDHHAPDQGAQIFSVGSGSIVAAFIGVNVTPFIRNAVSRRKHNKES